MCCAYCTVRSCTHLLLANVILYTYTVQYCTCIVYHMYSKHYAQLSAYITICIICISHKQPIKKSAFKYVDIVHIHVPKQTYCNIQYSVVSTSVFPRGFKLNVNFNESDLGIKR